MRKPIKYYWNMKRILYYITLLSLVCFIQGCNDSYMDRTPMGDLTGEDVWTTELGLKSYNNGTYNEFAKLDLAAGFGIDPYDSQTRSVHAQYSRTDDYASKVSQHQEYVEMAAGIGTVPVDPTRFTWDWTLLYRCNYFFENYNQAESLDQKIKDKYAGETHFFRAWFYFDKVQKYGDVPLVLKVLNINSPELYEERNPRKEVMDAVLKDITDACDKLPTSWDGDISRVTKWTALALKSRICLYEGTYRKYHQLGDEKEFLDEAYKAAEELIAKGPYRLYSTGDVKSDLRSIFVQTDLMQSPQAVEVILGKVYQTPNLGHAMSDYLQRGNIGATKSLAEDYLCLDADGKARPVALSTSFKDENIEDFFINRDPRLAQTLLDPRDGEKIFGKITPKGYPLLTGMSSFNSTISGYNYIRCYDKDDFAKQYGNHVNDYPVIRYAEVLLNFAEAACELGKDPNEYLPRSINLLRARAGMPNMEANPQMDPKYASEGISSLLVEIRRERRIETVMEDLRYHDLMRWKKGSYLAQPVLGMRILPSDLEKGGRYEGAAIKTVTVNGKDYIDVYAGTQYASDKRVFNETKDYLRPIPLNALAKNPNLKQNPNWGK